MKTQKKTIITAILLALWIPAILATGSIEFIDSSDSLDWDSGAGTVTIAIDSTTTFTTGTPCECDVTVDHQFIVTNAGINSTKAGYDHNFPNFEGQSVHGVSSDENVSYTHVMSICLASRKIYGHLVPTYNNFSEAADDVKVIQDYYFVP